MFETLSITCVAAAIGLLIALSIIDLKHWILPDKLNLSLALCGIAFHFFTTYKFLDLQNMILGAASGAGILYAIRFFANRYYGRDTLGLGDVKLLGAAGFWLGLDGILQAVTAGALAGLVHGLIYAAILSHKTKEPYSISGLSVPAGPGFAVGIVIAGYFMFASYIMETLREIFA